MLERFERCWKIIFKVFAESGEASSESTAVRCAHKRGSASTRDVARTGEEGGGVLRKMLLATSMVKHWNRFQGGCGSLLLGEFQNLTGIPSWIFLYWCSHMLHAVKALENK
ncbi:uncharacterized protein LOC142031464 isoform X3 [Buteo buteo]|uniref:uncharacterized protein LOC142031464 isoform X3 n=1 Tax=Buteo buteo TaxID=30397 RepID=UPI003EBCDD3D